MSSTILHLHYSLPLLTLWGLFYAGQPRDSRNLRRPEELPTICRMPLWFGREYNKTTDASLKGKLFKSVEMVSPGEWGHCKLWAGAHLTWGVGWGGRGTSRPLLGSSWSWLAAIWLAVRTSFQDAIKSLFWMHRMFCQNNQGFLQCVLDWERKQEPLSGQYSGNGWPWSDAWKKGYKVRMVERILKQLERIESVEATPRGSRLEHCNAHLLLTWPYGDRKCGWRVGGEPKPERPKESDNSSSSTWFGEEMKNVVKEPCMYVSRLVISRNQYLTCASACTEWERMREREGTTLPCLFPIVRILRY